MPNYQVVRCASDECAKFQSQQEKKSAKWRCVVCGLHQSLKRVYFESSVPRECRAAVMELNMNRGVALEARIQQAATVIGDRSLAASTYRHNADFGDDTAGFATAPSSRQPLDGTSTSKWTEFVDSDPEEELEDGAQDLGQFNRITTVPPQSDAAGRKGRQRGTKAGSQRAKPTGSQAAPKTRAAVPARQTPYSRNAVSSDPKHSTLPALSQALASISRRNGRMPAALEPATQHTEITSKPAVDAKQHGPSRWSEFTGDSDSGADSDPAD
ncbi:hypothetical protein GQ54DRAFT_308082 [Martensiomyces pterosporus]|nr:hypothetical protein GQ54DRAFT_308082 [Martensiomyces pterosporus]